MIVGQTRRIAPVLTHDHGGRGRSERGARGWADLARGGGGQRAGHHGAGVAARRAVLGWRGRAGCLAVAGGFALAGRTVALNVAGWLGDPLPGQQALGLAADRLSGLFLAMMLGATAGVSVAFASWASRPDMAVLPQPTSPDRPPGLPQPTSPDRPPGLPQPTSPDRPPGTRTLAGGYALALGSVAVIMTAADAFTALFGWEAFGWEALTVAFYLMAGASRRDPDRAGAALITVAFVKVSGRRCSSGCCCSPSGLTRSRWRRSRTFPAGPPGRRRWCCCSPGSRSRPGWCRSRCGCRAGTRRRLARPARSWPERASTSPFTGCSGRSRCWGGHRAGWRGSCCCSAGSPRCSASRTPR